ARLIDGGLAADGRPYFAMELVEGRPITRHCEELGMAVAERLELFDQVCQAVELAHRNLVVHRDLKPSNVLVIAGPQAAEGSTGSRVKLLDFGIAKLLDDEAGELSLTSAGDRLMTPEYAAPEQILGRPVTTATDVHALGALLFELLTDERAFVA